VHRRRASSELTAKIFTGYYKNFHGILSTTNKPSSTTQRLNINGIAGRNKRGGGGRGH
jgi:hypothetical protein